MILILPCSANEILSCLVKKGFRVEYENITENTELESLEHFLNWSISAWVKQSREVNDWVFHNRRFCQIFTQGTTKKNLQKLPPVGFETRTSGSSGKCLTNWAKSTFSCNLESSSVLMCVLILISLLFAWPQDFGEWLGTFVRSRPGLDSLVGGFCSKNDAFGTFVISILF